MAKRKIISTHEDSNANTESTAHSSTPKNEPTESQINKDVYSRASMTTSHGRGSLSGWASCPLCNQTSQKKYALGRGISMHLDQVHTPWRPGKAELVRRERLRRRIQKYVHETFAKKEDDDEEGNHSSSKGLLDVSQGAAFKDEILSIVPHVNDSETREEYRDRLLKHYLGEQIWDRDGKQKSIVYDPTKEEEVQWSHRLLELAKEVEENHVSKSCLLSNHDDDKNHSKAKTDTNFIEAGYDRNGKKSQSYKESLPPFLKAASDGNLELIKTMVKDAKEKPVTCPSKDPVMELLDTRDRNGSTAEHWAAGNGHLDCLKYLFHLSAEYGASSKEVPFPPHHSNKRRRKRDGKTSLHYAARNGHTHIVRYLLDSSLSQVDVESGDGTTPLHLACYGGHLETIRYLMEERNADMYKTNEWDCGIGHWIAMSIQQDDKAIISILNYVKTLVRGDLFVIFGRAQKQGHTSVHKAAQKFNQTFIQWLAMEVKDSHWTKEQIDKAGRRDDGGHKPSDIWLHMGGSEEFHIWMKDQCGW